MKPDIQVAVLSETFALIGYTRLSKEEVNHFTSTGSVAAKCALDERQLELLKIDADEYVYIRLP